MRMRWLCPTIGLFALVLLNGCTPAQLRDNSKMPPATKIDPKTADEMDRFFLSWNANAQKIQSITCESVNIDGKSQGQPYTLHAKIAFEKDKRFRLLGSFAGKSQVDLGSNEEEIWFWIAKADPPAVYYCRRAELAGIRMATPFQPDWLIEAMGAATLEPQDYHPGPSNAKFLSLLTQVQAPNGQQLMKRVIVDRTTNRVYSFELYDPKQLDPDKKLVAKVLIQNYEENPETRTFVPRVLELEWPGEADTKLKFIMSSRKIHINGITPETAKTMFARTNLQDIEPQIDLAHPPSSRAVDRPARQGNRTASLTGQIER